MDEFGGVQIIIRAGASVCLAYVVSVQDEHLVVEHPGTGNHTVPWSALICATGFRRS